MWLSGLKLVNFCSKSCRPNFCQPSIASEISVLSSLPRMRPFSVGSLCFQVDSLTWEFLCRRILNCNVLPMCTCSRRDRQCRVQLWQGLRMVTLPLSVTFQYVCLVVTGFFPCSAFKLGLESNHEQRNFVYIDSEVDPPPPHTRCYTYRVVKSWNNC